MLGVLSLLWGSIPLSGTDTRGNNERKSVYDALSIAKKKVADDDWLHTNYPIYIRKIILNHIGTLFLFGIENEGVHHCKQ